MPGIRARKAVKLLAPLLIFLLLPEAPAATGGGVWVAAGVQM
jgi:hypothetical protein